MSAESGYTMAGGKKQQQARAHITNRVARREYHIVDSIETGIELRGTEVKSLRAHLGNLTDAFAKVQDGEVFLFNLHITPYEQGNRFNHDPVRVRKLLLHKNEIVRLAGKTDRKGMALIPLRLYFKRGRVKIELGIGQGKIQFDKREDIKRREHEREISRAKARYA